MTRPTRTHPGIGLLLCGLFVLLAGIQHVSAGAFADRKLQIDTRVDPTAPDGLRTNDGRTTLPPVSAGQTIRIELFVSGATGNPTNGYRIAFSNPDNAFTDNFSIVGVDGLVPQTGAPGPTFVDARSTFPFIVPPNDYLATVILRTRTDIPENARIAFQLGQTIVVDARNNANDNLNLSQALITFKITGFSLSMDLNNAPGDQALPAQTGIRPGNDIFLQIHGIDIMFSVGYILRFEYDRTQIAFLEFLPGTALPNVQTLTPTLEDSVAAPDSLRTAVEVTAAALGGTAPSDTGLLGTLRFAATPNFKGTKIRMARADLRRGKRYEVLTAGTEVSLASSSPDFDADGQTGFRDFILFAENFGSRLGDGRYDPRFDLDGNGSVGFSDFIVFSDSFALRTP